MDRDYRSDNYDTQPKIDYRGLLSPNDNYSNWISFVNQHESINPCLQHKGQNASNLINQIENIQSQGKRFCVRIELSRYPDNLDSILTALNAVGTADFAVLLDGGWVRDPLLLMTQVDGMIRNSLSELNATVPIIVSCTSISQFFTDVEGLTHTEFSNRELVDQLIANNNRRTIIYGDWGSTRPRTYGIASRPLPRIDYPTRQSWIFSRNKAKGWDFDDAAKEIVESDVWKKNYGLGVWGEQMIEQTCINPALGINSPQKNVASRVNIHLHRQAFYDIANFVDLNLDEDWEDD